VQYTTRPVDPPATVRTTTRADTGACEAREARRGRETWRLRRLPQACPPRASPLLTRVHLFPLRLSAAAHIAVRLCPRSRGELERQPFLFARWVLPDPTVVYHRRLHHTQRWMFLSSYSTSPEVQTFTCSDPQKTPKGTNFRKHFLGSFSQTTPTRGKPSHQTCRAPAGCGGYSASTVGFYGLATRLPAYPSAQGARGKKR
jgi:hypothetical protein